MAVKFEKINADRSWTIFDQAAYRLLGIDAATFVQRWDSGSYTNDTDTKVMKVAMLAEWPVGIRPRRLKASPVAPIEEALGLFAVSGNVTADKYRPDGEGVLTFNGGDVVKLRGGNKVGLSVSMRYRIRQADEVGRGPWKVTTVGSMYELQLDGKTFYEYHWHPISEIA